MKDIADAAANLLHAQNIRSLVEAMANHPDWIGEGRANYLSWSEVALAEADGLDPMLEPISRCFHAWNSETKGDVCVGIHGIVVDTPLPSSRSQMVRP